MCGGILLDEDGLTCLTWRLGVYSYPDVGHAHCGGLGNESYSIGAAVNLVLVFQLLVFLAAGGIQKQLPH